MVAEEEYPNHLEENCEENVEYVVEQIIHRRILNGEIEYLVKWKEFSDEENTWELGKNLDCPTLIDEFESQRQLKNNKRKAELELNELYKAKAMNNAFDYGYEAEEILSTANINEQILFLIKFMDLDQPEAVTSMEAYANIPQMVLQFYEKHYKFQQEFIVD